jgi:hypothetical protein
VRKAQYKNPRLFSIRKWTDGGNSICRKHKPSDAVDAEEMVVRLFLLLVAETDLTSDCLVFSVGPGSFSVECADARDEKLTAQHPSQGYLHSTSSGGGLQVACFLFAKGSF